MKVEVAVPNKPTVFVDVKQHFSHQSRFEMMMMWDLMSSDVGLTYDLTSDWRCK